MTSELERVVRDDYLGDLESRSIDEIRAMRGECQAVETGLSYLRRLIQGRIDIVKEEAERRIAGTEADLEDLIQKLPQILADRSRTAGNGRLPQSLDPGELDPGLEAELDEAIDPSQTAMISDLSADDLSAAVDRLAELEQKVSAYRQALFERLDALQAEIARRYRTGEASVESLLP